MIDPRNGQIAVSDEAQIQAKMREADFLAAFPYAQQDWAANNRSAYKLELSYENGWTLVASLHFEEETLSDVLMSFDSGEAVAEEEREAAFTQLHADLLEEWLGNKLPYQYAWGIVQLLKDNPYNHRFISVQYA